MLLARREVELEMIGAVRERRRGDAQMRAVVLESRDRVSVRDRRRERQPAEVEDHITRLHAIEVDRDVPHRRVATRDVEGEIVAHIADLRRAMPGQLVRDPRCHEERGGVRVARRRGAGDHYRQKKWAHA